MPELIGGLVAFILVAVYLVTPAFAFVAWRRTRRIADLERRLRDAERRLMTPRAAGWALPEPAREPADRPLAGSASADGERVEATAASASAAWSAEPATMPPLFRDAATLPRRFAEPPPHPDGDAEIEPGGVEIEPRDRDAAREAAWAPPALVVEEPHRPARATQPEPRPAGWQAIGTAWEEGWAAACWQNSAPCSW